MTHVNINVCNTLTDHVFTSRYTGALCRAERTAITEWRLFRSSKRCKNYHGTFKTLVQLHVTTVKMIYKLYQLLLSWIIPITFWYKCTFATLIKCAKTSALNRVLLADKISFWTRKFSWNTTNHAFSVSKSLQKDF